MTFELFKASAYAEVIANLGTLAHADNLQDLGQGENLAWSWSSTGPVIDYAKSVDDWYKEIDEPGHGLSVSSRILYDFSKFA